MTTDEAAENKDWKVKPMMRMMIYLRDVSTIKCQNRWFAGGSSRGSLLAAMRTFSFFSGD